MAKIPKHLSINSKKFYKKIITEYILEDHHLKILKLACEALDRIEEARKIIIDQGAYYLDKYDKPKVHPALNVERDNRILFARLVRELCLDIEPPGAVGRPPGLYK